MDPEIGGKRKEDIVVGAPSGNMRCRVNDVGLVGMGYMETQGVHEDGEGVTVAVPKLAVSSAVRMKVSVLG